MQPLRDALDAFNGTFRRADDGRGAHALYRGNATVTGVRSPFGLYRERLATYGRRMRSITRPPADSSRLQALPLEAFATATARESGRC